MKLIYVCPEQLDLLRSVLSDKSDYVLRELKLLSRDIRLDYYNIGMYSKSFQ